MFVLVVSHCCLYTQVVRARVPQTRPTRVILTVTRRYSRVLLLLFNKRKTNASSKFIQKTVGARSPLYEQTATSVSLYRAARAHYKISLASRAQRHRRRRGEEGTAAGSRRRWDERSEDEGGGENKQTNKQNHTRCCKLTGGQVWYTNGGRGKKSSDPAKRRVGVGSRIVTD